MIAWLAHAAGQSALALVLWEQWELIVFPFQATVVKAGGYFIPAWPASVAIAIGIALWVSVAIVFGWLTRKLSVRDQAILAPLAIIAVAILTHIALGWTGYTVQQDGL